jgi:hypothetical protein
VGSITLTHRYLKPKVEQVGYALFLIAVAGFYACFTAYFGADGAWPLETRAIVAFSVMGLIGTRFAPAIIVGYPLHGIWDLLHELQQHDVYAAFLPDTSTPTPLAYGVFCATYDFGMAGYFVYRRRAWAAG